MNKKLYVGNLPFTAEESQLQALFAGDGRQVASVRILQDKMTGRSRGFGFVEMATPEDAQKAIDALHGHEFMGRPLTVNEAREMPPRGEGGGGRGFGREGGRNFGGGGGRGDYGGGHGGSERGDRGYGGGGGGDRGFGGGGGGGFNDPSFDPQAGGGGRGGRGERERGDRKRNRHERDDD